MHWIPLTHLDQLDKINSLSHQKAQVIFKHSTRCSISSMALNRLERENTPNSTDFYLLDLIQYRALSNEVADRFGVHHESPQVLVIKKGECVYDESHQGITMAEIEEQVA